MNIQQKVVAMGCLDNKVAAKLQVNMRMDGFGELDRYPFGCVIITFAMGSCTLLHILQIWERREELLTASWRILRRVGQWKGKLDLEEKLRRRERIRG